LNPHVSPGEGGFLIMIFDRIWGLLIAEKGKDLEGKTAILQFEI